LEFETVLPSAIAQALVADVHAKRRYLSKYPDVFIRILTGYQDIRRVPQGPQPTFVRALRYGFFQLCEKRRSAVHGTALKECFETKSI